MKKNIVEKLEWDSNFWKVNIAFLHSQKIRENIIKFAFEKCREDKIDCLFYLCNCHDPTSVQLAEKHGFHFTDIRITFDFNLKDNNLVDYLSKKEIKERVTIRNSEEADLETIKEIAENGYNQSRYFFDSHFPTDLCKKFYSDWIEKSSKGKFDDIVLVADIEDKAIGYITCKVVTPQLGTIGLVGVAPQYQRRCIGIQLIKAALEWFNMQNVSKVQVVTQARNIPAQRLYQSCEFKLVKTEIWYHKWFAKNYQV